MSREIEYEDRVLINKEEYEEIVSFFLSRYPNHHFLEQTNYYFDTLEYSLKNSHIVCRLRSILNKKIELTLKIKQEKGDIEITSVLTYNQEANLLSHFEVPEGDVKKALLAIGIPLDKYKMIGSLKSKRLEISEDNHLIVIDMNTYGDIVDYNIEVEAKSKEEATKQILLLCQQFNLKYKKDYSSKSSRLFNSIKNR